MEQPAWDDPAAGGTMIRGALWLVQVVGEGNQFTKNQLREAFPGVSQVDRRIRDLREFEWVVHTSNQDASLLAEDQRFVKAGVEVWDQHARRSATPQRAISAKERQAVLSRDGYMCTLCGIAGGETYPDDSVMTAVLAVSRRPIPKADGLEEMVLVTECNRCRSGGAPATLDVGDFLLRARELDPGERRRLHRWMERGRRGATDLDRAWAAYLRIPPGQREETAVQIHRML